MLQGGHSEFLITHQSRQSFLNTEYDTTPGESNPAWLVGEEEEEEGLTRGRRVVLTRGSVEALMTASEPEPEPERERALATPPSMYGQPGDHRYTFPEDRIPSDVALKTAAE